MTAGKEISNSDRRVFLKFAGLGAASAAAAAVVAGGTAAPAEAAEAPEGAGYRETEHVKTFYETARF